MIVKHNKKFKLSMVGKSYVFLASIICALGLISYDTKAMVSGGKNVGGKVQGLIKFFGGSSGIKTNVKGISNSGNKSSKISSTSLGGGLKSTKLVTNNEGESGADLFKRVRSGLKSINPIVNNSEVSTESVVKLQNKKSNLKPVEPTTVNSESKIGKKDQDTSGSPKIHVSRLSGINIGGNRTNSAERNVRNLLSDNKGKAQDKKVLNTSTPTKSVVNFVGKEDTPKKDIPKKDTPKKDIPKSYASFENKNSSNTGKNYSYQKQYKSTSNSNFPEKTYDVGDIGPNGGKVVQVDKKELERTSPGGVVTVKRNLTIIVEKVKGGYLTTEFDEKTYSLD